MSLLRTLIAAAALAAAPLGAAHADAFDGCEVAPDADLAAARGGFVTPDGITFDLGAIIRTYQDGELALMTQVNWTPQGAAIATQTPGSAYATAAAAAQGAADRLANGAVSFTDGSGSTAIVHDIAGQSLRNLIVTSASDTRFLQDIEVTITLPGFEAMQAAFTSEKLGIRLGGEINALLSGGL